MKGFSTKAIHIGKGESEKVKPVNVPIYQSTNFFLDDEDYEAILKGRSKDVYLYTRYSNPTRKAVEKKIAALEGGEEALLFSSGMGAISATLLTFLHPGDHLVSSRDIYGGTYKLMNEVLPSKGIEVTYVDPTDPDQIKAAVKENTKVFLFETLSNPLLKIFEVEKVADFAHSRGIKIIVDNTFLSPYNFNPLSKGADLVLHSVSKYLNGHSDVIAGVVVGKREDIEKIWHLLLMLGASPDPFQCYLIDRGLKTLALRMERHNQNAMEIARFLEEHPEVEKVFYPGLPSHSQHNYAKENFRGFSGMVTFVLKGGDERGVRFMHSLKVINEATSLGGVESLVSMPFNTSHVSLDEESRRKIGILPGTVRLSVGVEDVEDLIEDLEQAIKASA